MRALGIDPGSTDGGLAIVDRVAGRPLRLVDAIDIPTLGELAKKRVDVLAVARWLDQHAPIDIGVIERVGLMPDQDVGTGTVFMRSVGHLEAVIMLAEIRFEPVETVSWKKAFGLHNPPKIEGEKIGRRKTRLKEASRQKAIMMFPQAHSLLARKCDHGRAEAALIATFGIKLLGG